jgi:hypothetical protein
MKKMEGKEMVEGRKEISELRGNCCLIRKKKNSKASKKKK